MAQAQAAPETADPGPTVTVEVPEVSGGAPAEIPLIVPGQKDVESLQAGADPTPEQEAIAIRSAAAAERPERAPKPERGAALKALVPPAKGRTPAPVDVPAAPKGDADARALHRAREQMLELARSRRTSIGADEFAEIERRIRWYRKGDAGKAAETDRSILSEFTGAFSKSLVESNPEMFGASLEAAGLLAGSRDVARWGIDLQKWAKGLDAGQAPSVGSIRDIRGLGDSVRFIMGGLGSGLGSTVPSLAGGAGGAAMGQHAGAGRHGSRRRGRRAAPGGAAEHGRGVSPVQGGEGPAEDGGGGGGGDHPGARRARPGRPLEDGGRRSHAGRQDVDPAPRGRARFCAAAAPRG